MKHAFLIDGRYSEVGPFDSAYLALHFLQQHHPGKTLEHVELRPPEHVGPVKEIKEVHKPEPKDPAKLPAAPTPEAAPVAANEDDTNV